MSCGISKQIYIFSFPEQLQPWIYVFLVGDNRYTSTSTCILLRLLCALSQSL